MVAEGTYDWGQDNWYYVVQRGQWVRTSYKNSYSGGSVLVEAFGMPNDSSAFEAQQKWRNEPGTVSFRRGNVFAVCSSPTETTPSLISFSKILENAWLPSSR